MFCKNEHKDTFSKHKFISFFQFMILVQSVKYIQQIWLKHKFISVLHSMIHLQSVNHIQQIWLSRVEPSSWSIHATFVALFLLTIVH